MKITWKYVKRLPSYATLSNLLKTYFQCFVPGGFEKVIDLLFITSENNNHYCWIKNFDGLVSKQINQNSHKYFLCKNVCMCLKQKIY